jgi:hypothetical protein
MPVIPVNRVVDPKKEKMEKMKGRGGGEAQGSLSPPPPQFTQIRILLPSGNPGDEAHVFLDASEEEGGSGRHGPHVAVLVHAVESTAQTDNMVSHLKR